MTTSKPPSVTVLPWLRANLGKGCLAPLTSTDTRALRAAVQIIDLYAYNRHPNVLRAFAAIVLQMQESTRELAYHGIAHVMCWSNRAQLWQEAGLPPLSNIRHCEFE